MKITEEMVAARRVGKWPDLLPLDARFPGPSLPDDLVSDSWDMFPQLDDRSGRVVALLAFTLPFPKLSREVEWYAIEHQSGGLACHHPRFIGTPLTLRPERREQLEALAARYFEKHGGHFYQGNLLASDLISYVSALAELGFHCERSYSLLEEGVYPIDATQEHLDFLAFNAPKRDQLVDGTDYGKLTIIILAENSD